MKKITLWYLASYLILGGAGFAFFPDLTMTIFLSDGDYGEIMPRALGMFMLMLGGLVASMVRNQDFTYYVYSICARSFAVLFLCFLYIISNDLMFIVLVIIVLIGLLPSMYVLYQEKKA
jgi:hypothetical protein